MSAVTNQSIDNRIDTVSYYRLPGTTVTICQIKMVNGFTVLGESACVNPADFDQEKGEQYAHENAREKLWPLEGYLAAERRYQEVCQDPELSLDQEIELFSIHDKVKWLFSQPISRFNRFGLVVVTECWYALEGHAENAHTLTSGMVHCISGMFDMMFRKEAV